MEDRPRILVIDDEAVVLDACTQVLEGGGYQLATAGSGARGLELVPEFRPDVVFVDLKMPGLSGFEVLERLQMLDACLVAIVITGYATVSSAVEAMQKGAYDFLPKPFTPEELRLITRRAVDKRRLMLEAAALRREKEMLREHFAAIVSHELKSPLGAVQQNLYVLGDELQRAGALTGAQQARLERMRLSLDRLLKLVQTWLRLYSVDLGGLRESFKPVSAGEAVSQAVESVQPHAARKEVEVLATVQASLPPVLGDEGTLVEALVNLLGNAIKYSRLGGRVEVAAEASGTDILFRVRDTGVGIAGEDLPFIFDDFYSGRSGPGGERGSGVGLAVTRRIVEAHGGDISVDSQPGKGSVFTIRLPALELETTAPAGREGGMA